MFRLRTNALSRSTTRCYLVLFQTAIGLVKVRLQQLERLRIDADALLAVVGARITGTTDVVHAGGTT